MRRQSGLFGLAELDGMLSKAIDEKLAEGIDSQELSAKLEKLIPGATAEAGKCLLRGLKRSAPAMLKDRKGIQEQFQQRLHKKWRRGLDYLKMLLEGAREAGEQFNNYYRPKAVSKRDLVFEALVRLHARACLISGEVFWLMVGGFASGAMARWRTLHEVSVVAFFIEKNGPQVAERYLLHHLVESCKAAQQYQEHCAALGRPPLAKRDLRRLGTNREKLCRRFGKNYASDWGWAADALKIQQPSFAHIEEAVSLRHFRPYFAWRATRIMRGPKGFTLTLEMP